MNTALKEAVIAEIIPSNPMDRIESMKKEVYIPEFYTDDELIKDILTWIRMISQYQQIWLKQNLICHLYQMTIKKNKYLLVLDKCSKEYISKHFLKLTLANWKC